MNANMEINSSSKKCPVNDNTVFKLCTKGTSSVLCVATIYVSITYFSEGTIKYPDPDSNSYNTESRQENSIYYIKNEPFRQFFLYYPYIIIILFLQAIISYLPRFLWNLHDKGRMKALSHDLNQSIIIKLIIRSRSNGIIDYINEHLNPNIYAFTFLLHEFLVFVITIGQIFFMNYLLDYQFYSYFFNVVFSQDSTINAVEKIFPETILCENRNDQGNLVSTKTCVLPLNCNYASVYLYLWLWFVMAGFLTTFVVIYRIFTCLTTGRSVIGDFFILNQLRKNISTFNYANILRCYIEASVNPEVLAARRV